MSIKKSESIFNNNNDRNYFFIIITRPITLKVLIILTGSILSSLLISSSSMIAYSQTPEQSSPQLSSPIPGLLPPPQLGRPRAAGAPPAEGLIADGTIDSIIFAPGTRWIATGNWSMVLRNGNVTSVNTNMLWYNSNGTGTHTHEILNFKSNPTDVTVKPGENVIVKGLTDVGTNHRITWTNVHSTIDIKGGKTIAISLDDRETNKHFAGQTIYGIVKSFTKCSDQPGPNMEVLAPCS